MPNVRSNAKCRLFIDQVLRTMRVAGSRAVESPQQPTDFIHEGAVTVVAVSWRDEFAPQ